MKEQNYITSWVGIKNNTISLNGDVKFEDDSELFSDFIKAAYQSLEILYPKFFKMDNLSKLAFLAADVLLKNESLDSERDNNIALIFSNKASSLDTDRKYQDSIMDSEAYFPSPALFVYTLPNICLGEISIKHTLYSENSFFIFERFNPEMLNLYASSLLKQQKAKKVLCGWVNYDADTYEAFLYLVEKEGKIPLDTEGTTSFYNSL